MIHFIIKDMDKVILEEHVNNNLSTYDIAKEMECSQTNVRHWLRKYGLNTNHISFDKFELNSGEKIRIKNGKQCVKCQKELVGGQHKYCSIDCDKQYNKGKRNANTIERQKEISKERKLKLIELSGGECQNCGYNKNYAVLNFHHNNPNNKSFTLDARRLSNTRWDSILREHAKCSLLCANCHVEHHHPDKTL